MIEEEGLSCRTKEKKTTTRGIKKEALVTKPAWDLKIHLRLKISLFLPMEPHSKVKGEVLRVIRNDPIFLASRDDNLIWVL